MTAIADYTQALSLVRRLDRSLQARLIAEVVQELASRLTSDHLTADGLTSGI